jgi:hypothetical protein
MGNSDEPTKAIALVMPSVDDRPGPANNHRPSALCRGWHRTGLDHRPLDAGTGQTANHVATDLICLKGVKHRIARNWTIKRYRIGLYKKNMNPILQSVVRSMMQW